MGKKLTSNALYSKFKTLEKDYKHYYNTVFYKLTDGQHKNFKKRGVSLDEMRQIEIDRTTKNKKLRAVWYELVRIKPELEVLKKVLFLD